MKSILESLNPRTVWVGRDLKVHLVPWAGTPPSRQSPLPTGFEAQMAGNCMTAPPFGAQSSCSWHWWWWAGRKHGVLRPTALLGSQKLPLTILGLLHVRRQIFGWWKMDPAALKLHSREDSPGFPAFLKPSRKNLRKENP